MPCSLSVLFPLFDPRFPPLLYSVCLCLQGHRIRISVRHSVCQQDYPAASSCLRSSLSVRSSVFFYNNIDCLHQPTNQPTTARHNNRRPISCYSIVTKKPYRNQFCVASSTFPPVSPRKLWLRRRVFEFSMCRRLRANYVGFGSQIWIGIIALSARSSRRSKKRLRGWHINAGSHAETPEADSRRIFGRGRYTFFGWSPNISWS